MKKLLTILGATGSIGVNTLNVVSMHRDKFEVVALTAHRNSELLYQQCLDYRPRYAVLSDSDAALQLQKKLREQNCHTEVLAGVDALSQVASLPEVDYVMAAIVGAAGLLPTLAAVRAGKRVLLANKESLVMLGSLFIEAVNKHHATLLPIDSEHNAIFQCLPNNFSVDHKSSGVEKIILTASGGAFRNMPLTELKNVTPEQACTHPNWNMGRKITVDCATMMNKGLEVIEAHWLFGLPAERIQVILHPQSTIHSLVAYSDGSLLAQLGNPDMRTPIAYALAWPDRIASGVKPLDLITLGRLDFAELDQQRYPCLRLAYAALKAGGTATAILNAANEIAVQAFLDKKIGFLDIPILIERALEQLPGRRASNLETVLEDDKRAREIALQFL